MKKRTMTEFQGGGVIKNTYFSGKNNKHLPITQYNDILFNILGIIESNMKFKAFTMAEVLITLGIIGIIAAMTLPTLIGQYQKQVTINKLKRSYTVIAQMFNMARKDYGDPSEWSFEFGEYGSDNFQTSLNNVVKTYFLPYLDVITDCGTYCKSVPYTYKYLNDKLVNDFNSRLFYTIVLKDGSVLFISVNNDGKRLFDLIVYVDINGFKKPNIVGKDVFCYYLNTSGAGKTNFWGLGSSRDVLINDNRGCNKNGYGQYCGALIQYDGWQIKDDYPW